MTYDTNNLTVKVGSIAQNQSSMTLRQRILMFRQELLRLGQESVAPSDICPVAYENILIQALKSYKFNIVEFGRKNGDYGDYGWYLIEEKV